MKLEFSWQVFEKYSDINAAGRTDIMKLIVAFHNFANVPRKKKKKEKKKLTTVLKHIPNFSLCE